MKIENPKLRYGLEAIPVEHEGRQLIVLRDRMGYCEEPLVLSIGALELLMLMDGERSVRDIQAHVSRTTGEIILIEHMQRLLDKLDEHLCLENDRFIRAAAEDVGHFQRDPVRRMQHAGKSYPAEPRELQETLRGFFASESGGPGFPGPRSDGRRVLGLVAPHIDIQAGGACFAHAYKGAYEAVPPDTWVILGTGHEPVENCFALTRKDFETPLGVAPCDQEFCAELVRRAPRDILSSEYNHRREHSVEFQAVFLSFLQPGARIVPLLCSFGPEEWEADAAYIDGMAALLRDLAQGRSVGFVASVDLAHIGPRYGDSFIPAEATLAQHLSDDRILLEMLERCDAKAFMETLRREGNRRRICGMSSLYVLARILSGQATGKLLSHSHAIVDQHNSFVTFAGMIFHGNEGK